MTNKVFDFEDVQTEGGLSKIISRMNKSFEVSERVYEKIKWVCSGIGYYYDISKIKFRDKKITEAFAVNFSSIRGEDFSHIFCKFEENGVERFFYVKEKKI